MFLVCSSLSAVVCATAGPPQGPQGQTWQAAVPAYFGAAATTSPKHPAMPWSRTLPAFAARYQWDLLQSAFQSGATCSLGACFPCYVQLRLAISVHKQAPDIGPTHSVTIEHSWTHPSGADFCHQMQECRTGLNRNEHREPLLCDTPPSSIGC